MHPKQCERQWGVTAAATKLLRAIDSNDEASAPAQELKAQMDQDMHMDMDLSLPFS